MPTSPLALLPLADSTWTRPQPTTARRSLQSRAAICAACPDNLDGMCAYCGCQVAKLTTVEAEVCQVGRW